MVVGKVKGPPKTTIHPDGTWICEPFIIPLSSGHFCQNGMCHQCGATRGDHHYESSSLIVNKWNSGYWDMLIWIKGEAWPTIPVTVVPLKQKKQASMLCQDKMLFEMKNNRIGKRSNNENTRLQMLISLHLNCATLSPTACCNSLPHSTWRGLNI